MILCNDKLTHWVDNMVLVAGGDSFIFGTELTDQINGVSSRKTFPILLSKGHFMHYVCVARPGAANSEISRHVVNYCETHKDITKFVFVQWTFPNRYEYYFENIGWKSINVWDVEDSESVTNQMKNFSEKTLSDQLKNNAMLEDAGVLQFAKTLYKTVANSEYWEIYSSLKEIVFLQNYLKVNRIGYVFTMADNCLVKNHIVSNDDPSVQSLLQQIDFGKIVMFGDKQKGFYQWAIENKYPVGATHPLEEAHIAAALLIKDKFNELVKEHI
jgi:hypothetical protein